MYPMKVKRGSNILLASVRIRPQTFVASLSLSFPVISPLTLSNKCRNVPPESWNIACSINTDCTTSPAVKSVQMTDTFCLNTPLVSVLTYVRVTFP